MIQFIRKVSREEKKSLCILADLQGPKIRTAQLKGHLPVLLSPAKAHHYAARSSGHGSLGGHYLQNPGGKR